jgi:hypothetical protein
MSTLDPTLQIVLQLIYCSYGGLSQDDMIDLCGIQGADQIVIDTKWIVIEKQLTGYIMLLRGFFFLNSSIRDVVKELYLTDIAIESDIRSKLVTHFEKITPNKEKDKERKNRELDHQNKWFSSQTRAEYFQERRNSG